LGHLKAFICSIFKGELSKVDSEQSRQFTHNSSLSTVHSFAFTLAETLIVMGIIGVVAALTIPNLNNATDDTYEVAKFKKYYAELAQAHEEMIVNYGPIEEWISGGDERYFNRITEFLKVTKKCDSDDSHKVECVSKDTKRWLDGSTLSRTNKKSAILASGASFGINLNKDCTTKTYNDRPKDIKDNCGILYLDIDGPKKGKNTYGIDLFSLRVTMKGLLPSYTTSKYLEYSMYECINQGAACGRWIMDFGNMDYKYVNRSNSKCKNNKSKVLGYGAGKVQSCK
ncbi:type II secretion system protein, partial [bacterium]|nr:type II secretion system protein [bacterium]